MSTTVTFAVGHYDRVMPLFDGSVEIPGIQLAPRFVGTPVELFSRMLAKREFDIAEMSLTHCFALSQQPGFDFVCLPVFPSRMFRHGFIFVNRDAGITEPAHLAGKRIGVQGHQMTAAVWIRGLLRQEHGVDLDGVTWFEGGVNQPGVTGGSVMQLRPARPVDTRTIGPQQTLSSMLERGEIDALIGAFTPESFRPGSSVVRLFTDHVAAERAYFQRTGVFPIMHAVIVKREVFERVEGLEPKFIAACRQAQAIAHRRLRFSAALTAGLPWLLEYAAECDAFFKADPWQHGLQANAQALEAFSRILQEDGFTGSLVAPSSVFTES